ncbi:MAG: hypothetical protein JST05_04730 [Acidobacteria bacterium]|nr:hypothetical protein [Acidobacteriota bacterium]
MEVLYDRVLDLLRRLREAGRPEDAGDVLAALTQACNPREILAELRYAASEIQEEGLPVDLANAKRALLDEVERQWRDMP